MSVAPGRRQIGIEGQAEARWPVLQSGQQQHLKCVKADRPEAKLLRDDPLYLMLTKILHQTQHLKELTTSRVV